MIFIMHFMILTSYYIINNNTAGFPVVGQAGFMEKNGSQLFLRMYSMTGWVVKKRMACFNFGPCPAKAGREY